MSASSLLQPNNYLTVYCQKIVQSGENPPAGGASYLSVTGSSVGAVIANGTFTKVILGATSSAILTIHRYKLV